ncbi:MAG: hypothetical protein JKX82_04140 [Oleispira sp.]|nr:hypothetical protein [Oleispira sp.]
MKKFLNLRYLTFFIMLVLTSIFTYQAILLDQAYIYDENELMEHVQLLILVLVGIVFFLQAGESKWSMVQSSAASLSFLAYLGLALSFSFIIREMHVTHSEIDWLIFIVDGQGYKIIMVLLWVPLLYKTFQYKDEYIEIVKKAILSPTALFLMAAVACLGGGALFDKEIIVVEYFRFYEEVLEMNGYGFMLMAALSLHKDMVVAVSNERSDAA